MRNLPVVISASRMTDMPAFYPQQIVSEIESRKAKGMKIHTIVLWTKHIRSVLNDPLKAYLQEQQALGTQLYVQLTLTGIGKECYVSGRNDKKFFVEPGVPPLSESLKYIDQLIAFLKNPARIRLRVDPLIRLKDARGNIFSNFEKLQEIAEVLHPKGIRHITFSFLERDIYKKVDNRFAKEDIELLPPSPEERKAFAKQMNEFASERQIKITSCSVSALETSACIDGVLLQKLHDEHWPLDLSQPHSRALCGCTKSIDIGGWPPKACYSGCKYCYARPGKVADAGN
ncbi:MAG TPA: DUF1848 family protein, partial [Bacteroidales bacterium]|nr:DUF1848 family protein [Bacteroidales bacterium]